MPPFQGPIRLYGSFLVKISGKVGPGSGPGPGNVKLFLRSSTVQLYCVRPSRPLRPARPSVPSGKERNAYFGMHSLSVTCFHLLRAVHKTKKS